MVRQRLNRENVQHYTGSGCGGEFIRTNTRSHDRNRKSRNAARTAPQNSWRELNPARTRWSQLVQTIHQFKDLVDEERQQARHAERASDRYCSVTAWCTTPSAPSPVSKVGSVATAGTAFAVGQAGIGSGVNPVVARSRIRDRQQLSSSSK